LKKKQQQKTKKNAGLKKEDGGKAQVIELCQSFEFEDSKQKQEVSGVQYIVRLDIPPLGFHPPSLGAAER